MKRIFVIALVAALSLAAGCALLPQADEPNGTPDEVTMAAPPDLSPWWTRFNDTRLNALVAEALRRNRDLRATMARLHQSRAALSIASSEHWPQLDLQATAGRTRTRVAGVEGSTVEELDQYGLSAAAAYEVDVWRRVSASTRAAREDLAAAQYDLETVGISLAASVAETWFALNERLAILDLLYDQVRTSREFTELTELRFGQGLASALDVSQQRQQEASVRTLIPAAEAQVRSLRNALAVLVGRSTEDSAALVPRQPEIPGLAPLPKHDVTSGLLETRPDVRAAYARLRSADQQLLAAKVKRLPSVSVTGQAGYQSDETDTLFDDVIAEGFISLLFPFMDGGRRRADVQRLEAVREERYQACAQAILEAFEEVDNAMERESRQRETLQRLSEQLAFAEETLTQSRDRYASGLSDYLPVLQALTSKQVLQRQAVTAQRELLSYRIQLYRALGGTWASMPGEPQHETAAQE